MEPSKSLVLFCRTGDRGERSVYDRFRIEKFNVEVDGLYKTAYQYIILCPKENDTNLKSLNVYLDGIRILGSDIIVARELNQPATKIDDRTDEQIIELTGTFHSQHLLIDQAYLEFNQIFAKPYSISVSNPFVLIQHVDEITDEVKTLLQKAVDRMAITFRFKFDQVDSVVPPKAATEPSFFNDLIISQFSMPGYSANMRSMVEADEDFWMDTRLKLFTDAKLKKSGLMSKGWDSKSSTCLIDINNGGFQQNILNLLSIYERIVMVAPTKEVMTPFLDALNITLPALIELAQLGRIKFLYPNNFLRYEKTFLEAMADASPGSMLLTRRLGAITVSDLRYRNPLLFPTMNIEARRKCLRGLHAIMNALPAQAIDSRFFHAFVTQLDSIWYSYPETIHSYGALGTNTFGLSRIITSYLGISNDQDLHAKEPDMRSLYISEATRIVEWSAALNANLIPYPFLNRNVEPIYRSSAVLYSGTPNAAWVPQKFDYANIAINRLLVVNNDIPAVEFAKAFNSADVNLFRKQIYNLVQNQPDIESLNKSIDIFNNYVRQFDQQKNEWDISGFVLDTLETVTGLSFAAWTVSRLHLLMRKLSIKNEALTEFLDSMESDTLPSAIMVSRMRKKLGEAWIAKRYS